MLTVNKSNLYGCVWGHCALVVSGSCTKLLALDDHNVTNTCTSRACDTSPGCRACSSIENVWCTCVLFVLLFTCICCVWMLWLGWWRKCGTVLAYLYSVWKYLRVKEVSGSLTMEGPSCHCTCVWLQRAACSHINTASYIVHLLSTVNQIICILVAGKYPTLILSLTYMYIM